MKKPTVKDATRQEFVEFFTQSVFGQSGRWQFERWLSDKRYKELDEKLQTILDDMEKANDEMREWSQKALDAKDIDEKLKCYNKAAEQNEIWDRLNKLCQKVQAEIDEYIGLGE